MSDRDLVGGYRTRKDSRMFDEMMRRAEPAIHAGVKDWGGGNPALSLRARLVAADALKRYDPDKARAGIRTWVSSSMPKLARYRDARTLTMHVPDSVKTDVRHISRLKGQYVESHGEAPSSGWLKDKAGLNEQRFRKAMGAFSEVGEGTTQEGESFGVGETASDTGYKLWVDAVYTELDEPGRKIFEGVSGYMGTPKRKKQELARELGISPAAVSSRLSVIEKRLAEYKEGQ